MLYASVPSVRLVILLISTVSTPSGAVAEAGYRKLMPCNSSCSIRLLRFSRASPVNSLPEK